MPWRRGSFRERLGQRAHPKGHRICAHGGTWTRWDLAENFENPREEGGRMCFHGRRVDFSFFVAKFTVCGGRLSA